MPPRSYLFIHQNMPAQFYHLCVHLRDQGHKVGFITRNKPNNISKVIKGVYELAREPHDNTHPYIRSTESAVLHAQSVYRILTKLLKQGFKPDIVIGHAGWGETLLVKDLLPNVPLVNYFEFYYRVHGQDLNFDPEYLSSVDDQISIQFKNTVNHLCLENGDWGITPTQWQLSTYPAKYHGRISVLHEGVNTVAIRPNRDATFVTNSGKTLRFGQKIVTFVARNLEPYRGFHTFMRSIPELQRRHPDLEILIVGKDGPGYGRRLPDDDSYKKRLLAEVDIDLNRVHFTGHLVTDQFRRVMNVSAAHVYLTYPFVLSWSLIEAMASGCLIIGSRTAPVEEVIQHEQNGLLVDFFSSSELVDTLTHALNNQKKYEHLRKAARDTSVSRFDLSTTVPRQVALLHEIMRSAR